MRNYPGEAEFSERNYPNTLPRKDLDAPLDATERARLIKLTGTEKIDAPINRRAWLGFDLEDSILDEISKPNNGNPGQTRVDYS